LCSFVELFGDAQKHLPLVRKRPLCAGDLDFHAHESNSPPCGAHARDEEESPQIQSELTSIQGREYQIASVALPLMRQAVMARIPGGNTYGLPAHTIAYIGDALTQVRCARRNCVISDHE
jgi:hypothetical protein